MAVPPPAETVATFTTSVPTSGGLYHPAGDWDAPGVNPALIGDPRILHIFSPSRVSDPFGGLPTVSENGPRPSVVNVNKSWQKEFVTNNPGGQTFWGFENQAYFGDLGIPTNLTEITFAYYMMFPAGFVPLGGAKMPNLYAFDTAGGRAAAAPAVHTTGFVTHDASTLGLMHHKRSDLSRVGLHVYMSAFKVGGASKRYPTAHVSTSVMTAPGSATQYLGDKAVPWYVVKHGILNTVGQGNGVYEVYAQPAGQALVLRHRMTNVEYRTRSTTFWAGYNFRNFFGGGPEEQPLSALTTTTAPHFWEFVVATVPAALPRSRAA